MRSSRITVLLTALLVVFLLGCGDPTSSTPENEDNSPADTVDSADSAHREADDVAMPARPAEPVMCGEMVMLSSQEAITKSPREYGDAERLALMLTGELLASDDAYERVAADLAAISAYSSENPVIRFATSDTSVNYGNKTIGLGLTPETTEALMAETYDAWDCANEWYGVTNIVVLETLDYVYVDFASIYHPLRIVEVYSELPGITGGEADTLVNPSTDIKVCNRALSETHRYVFGSEPADGIDCLAGCGPWNFNAYDVNADGEVTEVAAWVQSELGDNEPEWYESDCLAP